MQKQKHSSNNKKKPKIDIKQYSIKPPDRYKLEAYLKGFYKMFPQEKFTIFHFVRYFKKRLRDRNLDAWMGVCGETGSGKSYFVLMSSILLGSRYNLIKNVAYIPKGDEILNKFERLKRQAFLIDEAAREMRAINFQSKQQQQVNIAAMTDRFKNNWVFLNMPNFKEFTKSMRRGNIIFRTVIPYRTDAYARVILQRKSRNWRSEDPWGDEQANKIYQNIIKRKKEITNDVILNVERSLPTTVMDFLVPNLAVILPDVVEKYEFLKRESRKKMQEEEAFNPKEHRYKKQYEDLLMKITKIIYFNKLGLGKIQVRKKAMYESLGISNSLFDKYLKMHPEKAKVPSYHKPEND